METFLSKVMEDIMKWIVSWEAKKVKTTPTEIGCLSTPINSLSLFKESQNYSHTNSCGVYQLSSTSSHLRNWTRNKDRTFVYTKYWVIIVSYPTLVLVRPIPDIHKVLSQYCLAHISNSRSCRKHTTFTHIMDFHLLTTSVNAKYYY